MSRIPQLRTAWKHALVLRASGVGAHAGARGSPAGTALSAPGRSPRTLDARRADLLGVGRVAGESQTATEREHSGHERPPARGDHSAIIGAQHAAMRVMITDRPQIPRPRGRHSSEPLGQRVAEHPGTALIDRDLAGTGGVRVQLDLPAALAQHQVDEAHRAPVQRTGRVYHPAALTVPARPWYVVSVVGHLADNAVRSTASGPHSVDHDHRHRSGYTDCPVPTPDAGYGGRV